MADAAAQLRQRGLGVASESGRLTTSRPAGVVDAEDDDDRRPPTGELAVCCTQVFLIYFYYS